MVIRVRIDGIGLFNGKIGGIYKTIDNRIISYNYNTTLEELIDKSVRERREISFTTYCSDQNCDFLDENQRTENGISIQGTYVTPKEPYTIITKGESTQDIIDVSEPPRGTIVEILAHTHPLRRGPETYHSDPDKDVHTMYFLRDITKGTLTLSFVLGRDEGKAMLPVVEMDGYRYYIDNKVPSIRSFQLALIYNCIQKFYGTNYRIGYMGFYSQTYVPEPINCRQIYFEEVPIFYMFREPYETIIKRDKKLPPIKRL
ncbi:hypothetical protein YN1_8450 [Nanoarchaeota archaeon]